MTSTSQQLLLSDAEFSSKDEANDTKSREKPTMKLLALQKNPAIIFILVFFLAMIGHEIALEAASTSFSQLDSLAAAVTLFQFGFCFILPFVTSRGAVMRTFPRSLREAVPYIKLSLLVFGATGLATESLKYVSYPTKVVFKSTKLIPTMVVATVFTPDKTFSFVDYLSAFLLCCGAGGYSYESGGTSKGAGLKTSYYGIILLTISIICDAVVPNLQQQLMCTPQKSSKGEGNSTSILPFTHSSACGLSAQAVMVNVNAVGFLIILLGMLLSGSLVDAVKTSLVDPRLLLYLTCIGLGLSTAVLAYTKLIKSSGPVVAVAVSTLRKVATIMLSYAIFPKPILRIHVISGCLVLLGVVLSTFWKTKNPRDGRLK
mmetsp:Transcript_29709/g.45451  ORF Transcript_29709/g.45451 Transcript_29709/m.45451 type:complete len:373 (-) Transcript_29709:79-1197(-)